MSEPIPEAIPTSADPRSHRPLKRARGANTNNAPAAKPTKILETLFIDPSRSVSHPRAIYVFETLAARPAEIVGTCRVRLPGLDRESSCV